MITRTNWSIDPRGRTLSGWIAGPDITLDAIPGPGPDGVEGFVRATPDDTTPALGAEVGIGGDPAETVYVSVWVRSPIESDVTLAGYARTGTEIVGVETQTFAVPADEWTELDVQIQASTAADSVLFAVARHEGSAPLDATMAYLSPDPGTYFDGDTPTGRLPGNNRLVYSWDATPHLSASIETYVPWLTVEVLLPPQDSGSFILNESLLDGWPLGDAAEALAWQPILAQAQRITTRRGGTRADVSTTIEVGTLTVRLIDMPPVRIRPSTPIRVRTGTGITLFTGNIEDTHTVPQREFSGASVRTRKITTIVAVDPVQVYANTMRYGAVVESSDEDDTPFSYEPFEARADRLLRRTSLPYEVAPNETVEVHQDVPVNQYRLPTAEVIPSVWRASGPIDLVPISMPTGWSGAGHLHNGITHQPGESYIAVPIHNLHPGVTYTIRGAVGCYVWESDSSGRDIDCGIGVVGQGFTVSPEPGLEPVEFSFVATAETHELMLTIGEPATPNSTFPSTVALKTEGFTLTSVEQRMPRGQNWMCQNIVYESTLRNHLDLCVNTVRGRWWVDVDGITHAAREEGYAEPLVTFSDTDPDAVSYVNVDVSFDTQHVINDARLQNHGRQHEPVTGTWVADDRTIAATDITSIATNGPRAGTVHTSVYDPPTTASIHYGAGAELAADYAAAFADANERISAVRLHMTDEISDDIAALDIYDPVDAEYEHVHTTARVLSIAHEITPGAWHTNIELIER